MFSIKTLFLSAGTLLTVSTTAVAQHTTPQNAYEYQALLDQSFTNLNLCLSYIQTFGDMADQSCYAASQLNELMPHPSQVTQFYQEIATESPGDALLMTTTLAGINGSLQKINYLLGLDESSQPVQLLKEGE